MNQSQDCVGGGRGEGVDKKILVKVKRGPPKTFGKDYRQLFVKTSKSPSIAFFFNLDGVLFF